MKKTEALTLFGCSSLASLAGEFDLSPSAIVKLPDPLPEKFVDRAIGRAVRRGILSLDAESKKRLRRSARSEGKP